MILKIIVIYLLIEFVRILLYNLLSLKKLIFLLEIMKIFLHQRKKILSFFLFLKTENKNNLYIYIYKIQKNFETYFKKIMNFKNCLKNLGSSKYLININN